jgi:adenosylmethionine-8-amino-7-oxononanoate aminotransferase
MANLDIFEREGLNAHVRENAPAFRPPGALLDLPIVGDVRGEGYFYGIELVKDKTTRETFDDDESERLLRGFLSKALFDAGLYCRADDRGDPVIQLAPPLIIGPEPSSTTSSRRSMSLTTATQPLWWDPPLERPTGS